VKSWRTTATGILAIVVAIAGAVKAELDGDVTTTADWGAVAAAIMAPGFANVVVRVRALLESADQLRRAAS
jgi:hypothetical protein